MLAGMAGEAYTTQLEEFAANYRAPDLMVRQAVVALDERQDGEPVTRVVLLLNDPTGDTWGVDRVRELRQELGRRATTLGLPPVSLTLVPESEAELVEAFAD